MLAVGLMAGCSAQGTLPHAGTANLPYSFIYTQAGSALVIARPALPLTYSDGLSAKRAATAFCVQQGARLNPAAFGHFTPTGWHFAKGCM